MPQAPAGWMEGDARAGPRATGPLLAPRDLLAAAGSGSMGGSGPAAALHPLEGDGLGSRGPRGEERRAISSRGSARYMARAAADDARRNQPRGVQRAARLLRHGLRSLDR